MTIYYYTHDAYTYDADYCNVSNHGFITFEAAYEEMSAEVLDCMAERPNQKMTLTKDKDSITVNFPEASFEHIWTIHKMDIKAI